ncbi:hypothetical protein AUR59_015030 [Stutzerimonas balearica]|uniref:hypothetical protein n=1 Tax=Stutzerimonas stutzeri group TaxID=136846 RepID=UPI000774AFC9|nr:MULTISPECIES: hypothetical protein [Stutzerimonas stutzeri group]OMG63991.1 hypothetical protein AUR59_015030 [Stutzerimonas balearica]RSH63890.1 hypothetical protein EGV02_18860 [Stutzerimonas stutzeri]
MLEKLGRFIDWVWSFPVLLFKWITDAFESITSFLETLPQYTFYSLCEGIVAFFNAIPVPDFFHQAGNAMQSIPPEVLFFASMFRLDFGVTTVLLASLIRFVIRRLPIIG